MLALRNTRPSLALGSFEHSFAEGLVLGYQRALGAERTLVLTNYGPTPTRVTVRGLPEAATLRALWPAKASAPNGTEINLPAQSVQVYEVTVAH